MSTVGSLAVLALAACAGAPPPQPAPPKLAAAEPCADVARANALANDGDKVLAVNVEEAISHYREALRLAPTEPRIAFKLALANRKKEDWPAMASALQIAVKQAPSYANYWQLLGYALEQLAKTKNMPWPEVQAVYERCIGIDPNMADCHAGLGNALLRQDDESGALASFTRAVRAASSDAAHYAMLADLYLRLDDLAKAGAVLEQAKIRADRQDPGLVAIYMLSASVHQARGEQVKVVEDLEQAKSRAHDVWAVPLLDFNLGSAYAQLKPPRTQEAISTLETFVARVCKGANARAFRAECDSSASLIQRLGGQP
jgi:tetratricopeptide (TPR) repeat protein